MPPHAQCGSRPKGRTNVSIQLAGDPLHQWFRGIAAMDVVRVPSKREPRVGQQQAKLYADCLEKMFGRRPLVFCSHGYEHWIWDDANYPPRLVQGFLKKAVKVSVLTFARIGPTPTSDEASASVNPGTAFALPSGS